MRPAFSLLSALFLMVLVSTLMLLVTNTTATQFEQTTSNYRKEQASLLAYSYTRFAQLAIQKHNFYNNTCLESIHLTPENLEAYHITITLQYIGIDANISCPTALYQPTEYTLNPSVLIDISVSYYPTTRLNTLAIEKKDVDTHIPKSVFYFRSLKAL